MVVLGTGILMTRLVAAVLGGTEHWIRATTRIILSNTPISNVVKYTLTNAHLGESANCSTVPYTLRGML